MGLKFNRNVKTPQICSFYIGSTDTKPIHTNVSKYFCENCRNSANLKF